jgi:hypothetical protein
MTIRKISLSEFTSDVNETKLNKDELAEKYGLPKTEIGRILKKYNLQITRKKHMTYEMVEDVASGHVVPNTVVETEVSNTPYTEEESAAIANGAERAQF